MKANNGKWHLMLSSPEDGVAIQTENSTIKWSKVKKLLGIGIGYNLKFDTHVETYW